MPISTIRRSVDLEGTEDVEVDHILARDCDLSLLIARDLCIVVGQRTYFKIET